MAASARTPHPIQHCFMSPAIQHACQRPPCAAAAGRKSPPTWGLNRRNSSQAAYVQLPRRVQTRRRLADYIPAGAQRRAVLPGWSELSRGTDRDFFDFAADEGFELREVGRETPGQL